MFWQDQDNMCHIAQQTITAILERYNCGKRKGYALVGCLAVNIIVWLDKMDVSSTVCHVSAIVSMHCAGKKISLL
jgi:hypothetical protein